MLGGWAQAAAFKHRNKSRVTSSTSGRGVWGGSGPRSGYLHNASMHPLGGVSGMSNREKTQGQTRDMLERLHLWLRNGAVSSQRTCWKWLWLCNNCCPWDPVLGQTVVKEEEEVPSISSFRWQLWCWTHQTAAPFLQQTCFYLSQTVLTHLQLRTCCF